MHRYMHRWFSGIMTPFKVFVLIVCFCAINVECDNKEQCDLADDECVTKASAKTYPDIVKGRPGVETSDPITRHVINVDVPGISYKLHNAKLTGLKDCKLTFVKFNLENESFRYGLLVPNLVIEGDYTVDRQINDKFVKGEGKCKSTYTDYEIIFNDKYAKTIDETGKRYHTVGNFTLELDVKGKTKYEYTGLTFDGESAVSEKNLQDLDELVRKPVMYSFMRKHVDNVNDFLKIVAISDFVVKVK